MVTTQSHVLTTASSGSSLWAYTQSHKQPFVNTLWATRPQSFFPDALLLSGCPSVHGTGTASSRRGGTSPFFFDQVHCSNNRPVGRVISTHGGQSSSNAHKYFTQFLERLNRPAVAAAHSYLRPRPRNSCVFGLLSSTRHRWTWQMKKGKRPDSTSLFECRKRLSTGCTYHRRSFSRMGKGTSLLLGYAYAAPAIVYPSVALLRSE